MPPSPVLQNAKITQLCSCVLTAPVCGTRWAPPECLRCLGSGLRDKVREAVLAKNAVRRIPTEIEKAAFTGAHCKNLWASITHAWRCPGCGRSKTELLRWTTLFSDRPNPYPGWAAGLHKHHDHGYPARFPETLVCEQCNAADGAVKRKLGLPKKFSFSPGEIRGFVVAVPHGFHLVDYATAARIYAAVVPPPPPLPPPVMPAGGTR